MPWLHLIFDAWEDYRKQREQDAADRDVLEAQGREAMRVFESQEMLDHHESDDLGPDSDRKKKKKKKKHKNKDKK